MKKLSLVTTFLLMGISCFAQTTKLPTPDMKRQTISVMETYKQRKSVREYSAKALSEQDLSDLLWAAQGQNREDGHLTSPTAMNRQEIRLYVFTEKSVSLYDPQANTLTQVASGDHRGIGIRTRFCQECSSCASHGGRHGQIPQQQSTRPMDGCC